MLDYVVFGGLFVSVLFLLPFMRGFLDGSTTWD